MRRKDLLRWAADLGWTDPPEVPPPPAGRPASSTAAPLRVEQPAATGEREAGAVCSSVEECASLAELRAFIGDCRRCGLAERRNRIVFGEGDPNAALMFVGEGPGAEEDRTGRPFVGQAGKLLDAMIRAMGLAREEVFIANVVKCRPPGNRDPRAEEAAACAPFLDRQIDLIRPRVLVALGKPAANRLTGTAKAIGALRGRWLSYRGVPLLATYHPAYLLRSPAMKSKAWEDLKIVMARLAERAEPQ